MSFNELLAASVEKRTKDVTLSVGDKSFVFTAHELGHSQHLHLAELHASGNAGYAYYIVYGITDKDGGRLSAEQVDKLSREHFTALFNAVAEVNKVEELEKN